MRVLSKEDTMAVRLVKEMYVVTGSDMKRAGVEGVGNRIKWKFGPKQSGEKAKEIKNN